MNPVLMICYNNADLTRRAVESVLAQDIPISLTIVNNGSTDHTFSYLSTLSAECEIFQHFTNVSPVRLANSHLARLFAKHPHVLNVPNDVILPPNFYRLALQWPRALVTASMTSERLPSPEPCHAISECTPMAVNLLRKWGYDALMFRDGYFLDENFFHYASDCDLALRLASCGIHGVQLSIPYWHYSSASLRTASGEKRQRMEEQANEDRAYFMRKWGFRVDSLEYGQVAQDPNWTGKQFNN